jgi:hypothetical protein
LAYLVLCIDIRFVVDQQLGGFKVAISAGGSERCPIHLAACFIDIDATFFEQHANHIGLAHHHGEREHVVAILHAHANGVSVCGSKSMSVVFKVDWLAISLRIAHIPLKYRRYALDFSTAIARYQQHLHDMQEQENWIHPTNHDTDSSNCYQLLSLS